MLAGMSLNYGCFLQLIVPCTAAVDMQHCGLSNIGVRLWLNLLRSGNLTLMVVDLRQNMLAGEAWTVVGVNERILSTQCLLSWFLRQTIFLPRLF